VTIKSVYILDIGRCLRVHAHARARARDCCAITTIATIITITD